MSPLLLAKEVYVITDPKALMAMGNTDVTTLSHQLQCIMLHIHQYSMHISCKPVHELYIVDWLSHNNYMENRDQDIKGMSAIIHTLSTTVNILICTSI